MKKIFKAWFVNLLLVFSLATVSPGIIQPAYAGISGPSPLVGGTIYYLGRIGGPIWMMTGPISIQSGFGTSPAITAGTTPALFVINVGAGGTASSGIVNLPNLGAGQVGWVCSVQPNNPPQVNGITLVPNGITANQVTLTNYNITTGATMAWTANYQLVVRCNAG